MKQADQDRFSAFTTWCASHGALIHPQLEVYHDQATKFSLRVRPDGTLVPNEIVLTCPTALTLSYLNALIGCPLVSGWNSSPAPQPFTPAFPPAVMTNTPPHVLGRLFLIQQYLLGPSSPWAPYIATLPQPEHLSAWHLPAFWPEQDSLFAGGTNVTATVAEMRENATREFKAARRLLKASRFPGWEAYQRPLYHWAFCIFTSRSFRPSLVFGPAEQAHILGMLPPGCGVNDFAVLLPLFDIPNHSPLAQVTWEAEEEGEEGGGGKGLRFRVDQGYSAGAQVFNNYGMKTNGELLLAYGFVLPPTEELHNDYVHLRKRGLEENNDTTTTEVDLPPKPKPKTRDFLISLRALGHPSSVVGRSRQLPSGEASEGRREEEAGMRPEFGLFEDALLWDLCANLATADELAVMGLGAGGGEVHRDMVDAVPEQVQKEMLSRVFSTPEAPEFVELVARVKGTLVAKLCVDYERFVEEEPEVDDLGPAGPSANQQLALQYRNQYGAVLVNAIRMLDPSVELIG